MFKKFFVFFICILFLSGCSAPVVKKKSPELTAYENMINRSLFFEGNTERIKDKLQKAKRGEKVIVAYLGGSVTEGFGVEKNKNYARISFDKLVDFIGKKANLEYINIGISGTDSVFGNAVADKEILSKNADIIFIEYATDDKPEQNYRESFESLIRNCLKNLNNPAVILLISCNDKGVSRQDFMIQLGKYYNLPVISVANAVIPEISASRMKTVDYFTDNIHPTEYGHGLIADFIMNYIKKACKSKQNGAFEIPQRMYPKSIIENMKFIGAKNLHADNDGSFVRKDIKDGTLFKDIAEYLSNTGNKPFEFSLFTNNLYLIVPSYKNEKSVADVFINDKKTVTVNLKSDNEFDSPKAVLLYSSEKPSSLKVSVKVIDETENKATYAELPQEEQTKIPDKSFESNISELNFPEEEQVFQIKKKNKNSENTVPFAFYGISYSKIADEKE